MESLEYIDSYFKGEIRPDEKVQFEERIQTDEEFAGEVAFYLSAIQAARSQNADDKKERFRRLYEQNKNNNLARPIRRIWPYIAAVAAVLTAIIVGTFYYLQPGNPPQLATDYISSHFKTMGVQMGNNAGKIEHGKRLYNQGNYQRALETFENIIKTDSSDYSARELAGIAALQLKNYKKAIIYFEELENNTELHVNSGKFYHALTLMQRNLPGDSELAKSLMMEVVNENLAGNQDARLFLKRLN